MSTCAICLDDISEKEEKQTTLLDCSHIFHTSCLSQLHSTKCPNCRTRFTATQIPPGLFAQIQKRENNDAEERNRETNSDLNPILDDLILRWSPSFDEPGAGSPPPTTARLEFIYQTVLNSFFTPLFADAPSRFRIPSPAPAETVPEPCIGPAVVTLLESLFPHSGPPLVRLLTTPVRGVTLNSLLEDYVIRHTIHPDRLN